MENNQIVNSQENAGTDSGDNVISFKDFVRLCISNWYWFAISVILCVGLGCYYILSSPPLYVRGADVLMRDDTRGNTLDNDVAMAFSNMGMFKTNANVYDEVFAIKSPMLMEEVVRQLDLNVSYATQGRFKKMPSYGSGQLLQAIFLDGKKNPLEFTVDIDGDRCVATDFKWSIDREKYESDKEIPFNPAVIDTIDTPIGRIVLRPNARYTGDKPDDIKIIVEYQSVPSCAEDILSRLESEQVEEHASIIHLSLTDPSTERAEDIINTLIDVYNQSWVDDRNQVAVATSKFINERLSIIELELADVDADISTFKSKNLIPDIASASDLYLKQATKMSDEIMDLSSRLQMAKYIKEYLENPTNSNALLPVNSGVGSASVEHQIESYNTLVLKRNQYAHDSSDENPLVTNYDARIAEIRGAVLAAINNEITQLNESIKTLKAGEAKSTARIAANPSQARYLLSVERQQKVKESLYLYLLQKREENELGQTFAPYKTRIISDARGSMIPVAPRKFTILAVAFLLGLFIPGAILFMQESFDTAVRGRKDIESLSLPYVGEIPQKSAKRRRRWFGNATEDETYGVLVHHGGTDAVNEAFRMVRSNIEFMNSTNGSSDRKVVMVTSAIPGSGKTFVSMNLAATFALKKKKVVVIDLDMRRHTLSTILDKAGNDGVSGYLAGAKALDGMIVTDVDGIQGLDLIPAGAVPPNPSELLGSERLKQLIADLRVRYDYVIIDCPPTEAVADARIITTNVDMTLFVIRAGHLDRGMIPEIQRFYDEGRYTRMAVLLNGTHDSGSHGGYSRYGYSYGYGYSYSAEK